jgi:hypothetical protein
LSDIPGSFAQLISNLIHTLTASAEAQVLLLPARDQPIDRTS